MKQAISRAQAAGMTAHAQEAQLLLRAEESKQGTKVGSDETPPDDAKSKVTPRTRKINQHVFDNFFGALEIDGNGGLDFGDFLDLMQLLRDGDATLSDEKQKLPSRAKFLDVQILRRVLEVF